MEHSNSTLGGKKWVFVLSGGLIVVAMGIAGYSLWLSSGGLALAGCGPGSGCERVLNSRWAYWLGIPVSALALPMYGGFLAGSWLAARRADGFLGMIGGAMRIATGVMIVGAAVWFVGVQWIALRTVCLYCMAAHVAGVAGVAVLWVAGGRHQPAPSGVPSLHRKLSGPAPMMGCVGFGVVGLAVLIAGQLLSVPKSYVVKRLERGPNEIAERLSGGRLKLYGGRFLLEVDHLPVIGSPDAPRLAIYFFTYTCPHCRALHERLKGVQQAAGGQLAIVCLPVPLERACNPMVEMTRREHVNSCEFGRLALALARLDRRLFGRFDDWLFQATKPPSLEAARAYALELTGRSVLEKTLAERGIQGQIQTNVAIYVENSARLGASDLPQLMLGNTLIAGEIADADELAFLLKKHPGLDLFPR